MCYFWCRRFQYLSLFAYGLTNDLMDVAPLVSHFTRLILSGGVRVSSTHHCLIMFWVTVPIHHNRSKMLIFFQKRAHVTVKDLYFDVYSVSSSRLTRWLGWRVRSFWSLFLARQYLFNITKDPYDGLNSSLLLLSTGVRLCNSR